MDNNVHSYLRDDDNVIDLKELLRYVLGKWRVWAALGLIGMLLGAGYGMLKTRRETPAQPAAIDPASLQLREIEQYARYQQMYDDQLAREEESVYLKLDPKETCTAVKRYLLRGSDTDLMLIGELYQSMLLNDQVDDALIEASGLGCTPSAMRELIGLDFRLIVDEQELIFVQGIQNRAAELEISAIAPDEESSRNMLGVLDARVQEMNARMLAEYAVSCDPLAEAYEAGHNAAVAEAQYAFTEMLAEYAMRIFRIQERLTGDDLRYYAETYLGETAEEAGYAEERAEKDVLKWAVVFGAIFCGLGVCVMGAAYLFDGHIKTGDDLLAYGLYPVAVLAEKQTKKRHAIDKLLEQKKRINDTAYLDASLRTLGLDKIMLCGDAEDPEIAGLLDEIKAMNGSLMTGTLLSVDAAAQQSAAQADGVVLLVHLFKTRRAEFEREIQICRRLGRTVLGTAIIG